MHQTLLASSPLFRLASKQVSSCEGVAMVVSLQLLACGELCSLDVAIIDAVHGFRVSPRIQRSISEVCLGQCRNPGTAAAKASVHRANTEALTATTLW